MAYTYDEAYTLITDQFRTRWGAEAAAIVGSVDAPEIRYAGVEKPDIPNRTFGRFVMDPVTNPQASLRNAEFGQRYENNGVIIIQLLVRISEFDTKAESVARKLAMLAQDIFRDPAFPGCFIFRNVRINNLAPEAQFIRKNVIAEYQFDELT